MIKESVSDTIANRLSDPRIEGMVSVTKVGTSPDLRNADVYLSIMGVDETTSRKVFTAIEHATRYIQTRLGKKVTSKFCPHLHFKIDEHFKHTLETLRLIDKAAKEYEEEIGERKE